MGRVEDILNRSLFRVDRIACSQAAEAMRRYRPDSSVGGSDETTLERAIGIKLVTVAISHQMNWNFLEGRIARVWGQSESFFRDLTRVTARDVAAWLDGYSKPERIRAGERAELLRDIGVQFEVLKLGSVMGLLRASGRRLGGKGGFLARLDAFKAYREDPLRKKSQVLIHELVRERSATFEDEENISPAIDYHIMRIYLRSGRVVPLQPELEEHLRGHPRPRQRLVTKLREAVAEALLTTAFYADLSVPEVNYIEWQLGRSVCIKGRPLCVDLEPATDLSDDVGRLLVPGSRCIFESFCAAYTDEKWRTLQEPEFAKSFY